MNFFDAHSHFGSSRAIVCTDSPLKTPPAPAFVKSKGLLPSNFSKAGAEILISELEKDSSLMVGEVGLDKRFDNTKQEEIIDQIFEWTKENSRSITLHCVRYTGRMIEKLKYYKFQKRKVLWHSFHGSPETAAELEKLGVIISFKDSTIKNLEYIISKNPIYTIETDYCGNDELFYDKLLQNTYKSFSERLNLTISQLEEKCYGIGKIFANK